MQGKRDYNRKYPLQIGDDARHVQMTVQTDINKRLCYKTVKLIRQYTKVKYNQLSKLLQNIFSDKKR